MIRPGVAAAFALAAVRLLSLFAVVFYGAERLTAWRTARVRLHMDWELSIPYVPAAYIVYFSVLAFPFVALWLARGAAEVRRWEGRMAAAIVVAGLCFVLLPADPGYTAPPADDRWSQVADVIAGRHNLLPSLHVALSAITLLAFAPAAAPATRTLLRMWFAALVVSVLLTHRHHVVDVVSGAVLALALSHAPRPGHRW